MKPKAKKNAYHHGDLRESLLAAAADIVCEDGVDGLSLRKLAERVGVSRTAPYHHFKDKTELLCAIAADGFAKLDNITRATFLDEQSTKGARYRQYIRDYIYFAANNPEIYDLMFGRTIWQQAKVTETLKNTAFAAFQDQLTTVKQLQLEHVLPASEDSLRFAQVSWGTLHGIARLVIDGVYADTSHIDEMCECAANLFIIKED
jgi:AcrR family transcriptional regulator